MQEVYSGISESNSEGAGPVTKERKKRKRKCTLALLLRPPEKHADECLKQEARAFVLQLPSLG